MDTKLTSNNEEGNKMEKKGCLLGLILVVGFSLLAGSLMAMAYPYIRERAGISFGQVDDSATALTEDAPKEELVETEIFEVDDSFLRYLTSSVHYLDFMTTPDTPTNEYFTLEGSFSNEEYGEFNISAEALLSDMAEQLAGNAMTNSYQYHCCGLYMQSSNSENLNILAENRNYYSEAEKNDIREQYQAGIVIFYDLSGVPKIESSWNMDYDEREVLDALEQKTFKELLVINGLLQEEASVSETREDILDFAEVPIIKNKIFVFAIGVPYDIEYKDHTNYWETVDEIQESGYILGVILITAAMIILALILQNVKGLNLRNCRLYRLPTEILGFLGIFLLILVMDYVPTDIAVATMTEILPNALLVLGITKEWIWLVTHVVIALAWSCYALAIYTATASLLPYITHPIRMFLDNSIIIAIFKWLIRLGKKGWSAVTNIKIGKKLEWTVLGAVAANWLVFTVLYHVSLLGIGARGFFLYIFVQLAFFIYNVGIYVFARCMVHKALTDYNRLYEKTKRVAGGDFEKSGDEKLGMYESLGQQLDEIEEGFRKAVAEEVKSRNMKAELITNVSHDLKTPLTAIITYIELLKKQENSEEERKEYLEVLEQKSNRLKVLIEDLFEVSKAESENIVLNYAKVDLVSLLKEVGLENEMKISESTLDIRFHYGVEKCVLNLDPARTFRIMDNLLQNILKYAMPHTRVYIDLTVDGETVVVCFKNISAVEMNFAPEEITERFVRGDLSRNSEGSGLGLAIAQSFTTLQGGEFKVETDGDLFKVTLRFKLQED